MNLKPSQCDFERIIRKALKSGAVAAGFTSLTEDSHDRSLYHNWLEKGFHATMEYMVTGQQARFNPDMVLEGARSALCAAFSYAPADREDTHPLFSDYARGDDYHTVLRQRLAQTAEAMETLVPGSHTRICVDSAPVRERFLAERAGVGKCTRSGMLYVPGAGTRVFLAEILWTHPVPEILRPILEDPCADCQLCQRACPGAAIRGDGSVDARKCLSYLTIEHKAELPDGLRLPGRIYGCDVCTGVCPLNAQPSPALPEFRLSPRLKEIDAETLENMGSSAFRRMCAHSAISHIPLSRIRRNLKRH